MTWPILKRKMSVGGKWYESICDRNWKRAGTGVTASVLNDGTNTFNPGISSRTGGVSTYVHAGMKNTTAQSVGTTLAGTRQYDAFGLEVSATGTWQTAFGYAGNFGYQETDAGLMLLGNRYYDAETGRFLTRDPIKDGRNWYGYCDNNPISRFDPLGLTWYYDSSTGDLWWDDPSTVRFDPEYIGTGFAGRRGTSRNNPDAQGESNQGPLPEGTYEIGRDSGTTRGGRVMPGGCIWIDQVEGNTFGRSGFLIHGGSATGDPSSGCIILPRGIRDRIADSGDIVLVVYDGRDRFGGGEAGRMIGDVLKDAIGITRWGPPRRVPLPSTGDAPRWGLEW